MLMKDLDVRLRHQIGRRSIVFRRLGSFAEHNRSLATCQSLAHLNPSVEASIHKENVLIIQNLELDGTVSFISFHQPERFDRETSFIATIVNKICSATI